MHAIIWLSIVVIMQFTILMFALWLAQWWSGVILRWERRFRLRAHQWLLTRNQKRATNQKLPQR